MDNPLTIKQISRIAIGLSSDAFEMDTAYQTFLKNRYMLKALCEDTNEKLKVETNEETRKFLNERLNAQTRLVQYEWNNFVFCKERFQKHLKMVFYGISADKYNCLEAN